ncbi:MAG: hypothetical protein Q4D96_08815 [Propionibacteriaceae bacterium]|nr:hypothetical protein [Propionibacteriaceae bacterium]
MSLTWRPVRGTHDVADLASADLLPTFDSRDEAEQWLGLYWSDLLDAGVAEVSLWEDDHEVVPPMSLEG